MLDSYMWQGGGIACFQYSEEYGSGSREVPEMDHIIRMEYNQQRNQDTANKRVTQSSQTKSPYVHCESELQFIFYIQTCTQDYLFSME